MNTSDITNYIQKMEQLIQMQQIELDKTRNLLGRIMDEHDGCKEVSRKTLEVPNEVSFDISYYSNTDGTYIEAKVLPAPMKSMYERITELKKELNL